MEADMRINESIGDMIVKKLAKILSNPKKAEKFKRELEKNPKLKPIVSDLFQAVDALKTQADRESKENPEFAAFYDIANKM